MGSDSYWFLSFINGFLYHRLYSHCWKPGMIGKLEDKPQLNSLAFTLTVISNHRLMLVLDLTNGSQPAAQLSSHENIQASSRPKRNRGKSKAWCSLTNCSPPLMKVPLQTASSSLTVGNTNGSTAWSLNSAVRAAKGISGHWKGTQLHCPKKSVCYPTPCPAFPLSVLMWGWVLGWHCGHKEGSLGSLGFNGGAITSLQQTEPCIYSTSPSTFIVNWRPRAANRTF